MSDGFTVFVIVILIVGMFALRTSFVRKKLNQHVFQRGGHRDGQDLVSQKLVFSTHASIDEVRRAILANVVVASSLPLLMADAYLLEATDTHILYGYGNRLRSQSFRGLVSLNATEDGVHGSWEIVNWTLADGIVAGQSVMKRLVADINTALRSVDPNAQLR